MVLNSSNYLKPYQNPLIYFEIREETYITSDEKLDLVLIEELVQILFSDTVDSSAYFAGRELTRFDKPPDCGCRDH